MTRRRRPPRPAAGTRSRLVVRIDSRADEQTFLRVDELVRVLLVRIVVLPEHEVAEALVLVDDGRVLSLCCQMRSLASLSVMPSLPQTRRSKGVMSSATGVSRVILSAR